MTDQKNKADQKTKPTELSAADLDEASGGYRYELKNVLVSSYSVSGASQDADVPSATSIRTKST